MTDYASLVQRLREDAGLAGWDILDEAADAIVALQAERDGYKQGRDLQSAVATTALDERDAAWKDAERYRWLRIRHENFSETYTHFRNDVEAAEFDAAIDAALAAQEQEP